MVPLTLHDRSPPKGHPGEGSGACFSDGLTAGPTVSNLDPSFKSYID